MGLQMEEISKKIEVGLDPQESFTKVDKDRDVKNEMGHSNLRVTVRGFCTVDFRPTSFFFAFSIFFYLAKSFKEKYFLERKEKI